MSISYLKSILSEGTNIVCLLGKGPAAEQGCDLYREDFIYDIETKYGRSPSEIVNSTFYNNRPEVFYDFYREEILKKRGEPDEVNYSLKRMEDDGKLLGIVTRGYFDLSVRAGCHNVIHLYGDIDHNTCPHCGRQFDADYVLSHKPLPLCDKCGTMIHPGIALSGEILDSQVMSRAIEMVSSADILLLIGADLQSRLGAMAKYFTGDRICLVNNVQHYSDEAADCVCIGDVCEIMHAAYPSGHTCPTGYVPEKNEEIFVFMTTVKTRFAPSPTGRMHVGNLRTALYSYLIARHAGGKFMLRIEDTDQERFVPEALDIIYQTLKDTGLDHDEGPDKDGGVGPYIQSERCKLGIYQKYADQLIAQGDAYYCFCTPERLAGLKRTVGGKEISIYDKHCLHLSKEEVQEKLDAGVPHVIRFNMPNEGTTTFHDEIYGDITVNNDELEDLILIKSDGYPTYNFANVIDDHLMGVTHVVRGSEYLSSTPKYNRIYEAFGWEIPTYVHCPLITNEQGQKLSKRSGHSSFEDLLDQGYIREAVVNFVALLGWSPQGDREIYSLKELIDIFDYHHINKAPAVFDMQKLKWMNGEYMKMMDDDKFYTLAEPYLKKYVHRPLDLHKIAAMVKTRIQIFPDIEEQVDFFNEVPEYDVSMYVHKKSKSTIESSKAVLTDVVPVLEGAESFDGDSLFALLKQYAADRGYKVNTVMWPIRTALSGKEATPAGATGLLEVLGKEESIRRIKAAIDKIDSADPA